MNENKILRIFFSIQNRFIMSVYVRHPTNETDGFIISYATLHRIVKSFTSSYSWSDVLYSRSSEYKEKLYEELEKHKNKYLSQQDYNTMSSRPDEALY